jgi:hypothetical protein
MRTKLACALLAASFVVAVCIDRRTQRPKGDTPGM